MHTFHKYALTWLGLSGLKVTNRRSIVEKHNKLTSLVALYACKLTD